MTPSFEEGCVRFHEVGAYVRTWFARLRLADTAIQAVRSRRGAPLAASRRPSPRPKARRPPDSCPAAFHLKVAHRSLSPTGESDTMPCPSPGSYANRKQQIFPGAQSQISPTPNPDQCACTHEPTQVV